MAAVAIRGTSYPVVLPKLRDPRLHLAATITSLQVLGQVAFHFRLSIAQILLCLGTCAVLEVTITLRKQHVIMWPASALLTGNGVAFVLRVPGTAHGDWWTTRGWWIFVATAGGALLSKHIIQWRSAHVFNPSNIGLVVCFLALGRNRADPLDFWWGPMSWWMILALAIIVTGGFTILSRLKLLRVALGFWATFAAGIGVLALVGHVMTARWHLGPLTGFHFWWVLVTSPEVLVFLFFMITDPKTAPTGGRARLGYAVALGVLASALIAPTTTEFSAKVALLSALAIVCVVKFAAERVPVRIDRPRLMVAAAAALVAFAAVAGFTRASAAPFDRAALPAGRLPPISILPSPGVQTPLDRRTAEVIAYDLLAARPARAGDGLRIHLEPGTDQGPPVAVAQLGSATYRLHAVSDGTWSLASAEQRQQLAALPKSSALAGMSISDVAASVGLSFRQGSFHYGISKDYEAMMGGGVCWLDYNGDGWQDLFAVNSYASADAPQWEAHGGLPRSALYENDNGSFRDVSAQTHAGLAVQGDGCAAGDLNGDGRPDLVVTTTSGVDVLWNTGSGFTVSALHARGWYTGAAIADVNGDGRPDIFAAGYSDPSRPVTDATAGFPTNLTGVRDLLFVNEGGGRFGEVGVQAGLESAAFRHGLGAQFVDVNGDARPDLYVANDEDPNDLYVNVPWPGGVRADPAGLGFRFEERAAAAKVADPFAGMGIASDILDGRLGLFVTNSRHEPSAAFRQTSTGAFANARPTVDPALGSGFAGWGASWVDLANTGTPALVLTAGAIPVTSLGTDAEPVRVLAPAAHGLGDATGVLGRGGLRLNGRGLAAADAGNDGRMQVAVNTIGGQLALLRASGPTGHWLDVSLSRFAPGAVVTAVLPDGRRLTRTVQAGSSYLSSEDPRIHFGLGAATHVERIEVSYGSAPIAVHRSVAADRIVTVAVPRQPAASVPAATSFRISGCVPAAHSGSVATVWDSAAVRALRSDGASEPEQARDLLDLAGAMGAAFHATAADAAPARATAVSFAAYRLLLWRASLQANLAQTFALLTRQLQRLCLSPAYTSTTGSSPAAAGNRAAAAAIAAGAHDGSNEQLRYADPTYSAPNAPLVVARPGSTVHDVTFWQPLQRDRTDVQRFSDAQWGRVRTFSPGAAHLRVQARSLGDPSAPEFFAAARDVLQATGGQTAAVDASPAAWNALAAAHASGHLAADLRLYRLLNGALNDAAVVAWRVKRSTQAPRPITVIRYLAFEGRLPHGSAWLPRTSTPASPGGAAEAASFAYAAATVLTALTGRSYASRADAAAQSALNGGIDFPADVAVGTRIGRAVGQLALR